MNYLPNNRNHTELDHPNWNIIEVSKVDDKIIKNLLNKLSLGISDDFFICFESLIKIGEKAKPSIISFIQENEVDLFIKNILFFILHFIEKKEANPPFLLKLYNPDFIIRARTIMELEAKGEKESLKFLLPLIDDPDDSVRWALIKMLVSLNLPNNPLVRDILESRLDIELNPIIIEKIKEIL
ncbi:MAG: HEAT repeat domain-containing protein [Promethearchaeati archaeon]